MPKGIYTQTVCVLLEQPVKLPAVQKRLLAYDITGQLEGAEKWAFGGPGLVIAYRPDVNGMVVVDTVDHTWPDEMGMNDTDVFGAWSIGLFGPFAYPDGLARAADQCWAWPDGKEMPMKHQAFLRVRSSYVLNSDESATILPEDYEPLPELEFVTNIAASLLDLPEALCYFNPNGEILCDQDSLRERLNWGWANSLPAFDAWCNIRLFNADEGWFLMDSVGNSQLDIPDMEACFLGTAYDFSDVDNFLRNIALYVLNNGEVIADGDTMDGPGDIRWQARGYETGITDPPRRVIRWLPDDDRPLPPDLEKVCEQP